MQTVTNERGSVIVFITLMVVILMVMVGIGLDTGHMTYSRNLGQGAVDAAALSAVSGLPTRNPRTIADRAAVTMAQMTTMKAWQSNQAPPMSATSSTITQPILSRITTNRSQRPTAYRVALEGAERYQPRGLFLTPLMRLFGDLGADKSKRQRQRGSNNPDKAGHSDRMWQTKCGGALHKPSTKPDV